MIRPDAARIPLSFVAPGQSARIEEVGPEVDPVQRAQLTAYGVSPGRLVRVMQQRPMTLVLADEVELALEPVVARHLWVAR